MSLDETIAEIAVGMLGLHRTAINGPPWRLTSPLDSSEYTTMAHVTAGRTCLTISHLVTISVAFGSLWVDGPLLVVIASSCAAYLDNFT